MHRFTGTAVYRELFEIQVNPKYLRNYSIALHSDLLPSLLLDFRFRDTVERLQSRFHWCTLGKGLLLCLLETSISPWTATVLRACSQLLPKLSHEKWQNSETLTTGLGLENGH